MIYKLDLFYSEDVPAYQNEVSSRENIYRREAKLLLLTEIRATAAPLAAWGVTSWLSAVNTR